MKFINLFLFLFLTVNSQQSHGATNSVSRFNLSEISVHDIAPQLTYLSMGADNNSVPLFKADIPDWLAQFPPHHTTNTFGDRYLTAFDIYNDSNETHWFLYPYGSAVENVTIHSFDGDSAFSQAVIVYSGHQAANQIDFHYGSQLSIAPGQSKTIIMLFDSPYFFAPIKILLQPLAATTTKFKIENTLILLCLGICLALGIFNLFVYWVVRQAQYFNYALATLSYAIGWASVFGLPELLGLGSSSLLLMPSYIVGAFFSCFFFGQFLDLKSYSPRVGLLFKLTAVACLVALPFAFYNQGMGLYLASILTSIVLFTGLYGGIKAWRLGHHPARYFTLALLAVLLPNSVGNLMNLGILPSLNINIYLLGLIGNSLDCLLLAFAMAAQVRIVNLKNIQLNQNLENVVKQRTLELTKTNQLLEKTNTELVDANLAKGRFLASVSHEIRTPLTSIIGYADGILMGDIDKAEQERVIKIIAQNGNHLLAVINDILDISKIDANKLEFESVSTPLFSILAQVESTVGKRARDKGLAFHIDYQYPLPAQIQTDPTRLRQILFNLTNNAIKFTEQGYVGITVCIENKQLVIKVKDTGEGIASNDIDKLFEPFTQADNSINRRFGGTGLGLSISQKLAHGLEGKIDVESALRIGSCFCLRLKLVVANETNWIHSVSDIWQSTPRKSIKPLTLPNFEGNRVLIADDHPSNRELIAILLKKMNISVVEVENGQQVLDTLFYQKFDLLLLDIHMPQMDGTEALKQIRASGNTIPIIALTANNMKHEVHYYLRLGFSDHLAKPINRSQFIAKLSKYLTKQALLESPIHLNDLLSLTRDYQQDLVQQLKFFESAWQNKDMQKIRELAHRIKGSASAFGYDLISRRYAEIEQSALQDDEVALVYELPNLLNITKQCTDLPRVDIPLGIINHNNSVEQFIYALYELITLATRSLEDLKHAVANRSINSAIVYLNEFTLEMKKCALLDTYAECKLLEKVLLEGKVDEGFVEPKLATISLHLSELEQALTPHILEH